MPRTRTTAGPGSTLALKHGGYATVALAPRTAEILAELEAGAPLQFPIDRLGLQNTAIAQARLEEVNAWFEGLDPKGRKRGAIDSRGRPRAALKLFIALYREVHRGLAAHGATAQSRALMAPGLVASQRYHAEALAAQQRMRERLKSPKRTR